MEALKKVLPEELYKQVEAETAKKDDFSDDYVPRTRLNKVIGERNELRSQLDSLQTEDPAKKDASAGASKQETVTFMTQEDVNKAIQAIKDDLLKQSAAEKLQSAVTEKLRSAKVRNPELLLPKLKLDGDIDAQLATWKKSDPYLFGDYVPNGTGAEGKGETKPDRASLEQQQDAALKAGNTALSISLKRQISELKE
jgi:hypothetical protein